jgi:paraquat-inducible protein B
MSRGPEAAEPQEARVRERRFSLIWLVPIAAAALAAYLVYATYASRGPLVTVTLDDAGGLTAGQTAVRYKAVQVGTVEGIRLSGDLSKVRAGLRMSKEVEDRLTDGARFWVVRPRLTAGSVSGLETIVSGAYIEFDPGDPAARARREFAALADPPGVRSDEPGRVFTLRAEALGSLDRGSPVFFRDVVVGEVLGFDPPGLDGTVALRVFVRAPYESYVREGSRFWNASGVGVAFGPDGLKLQLSSLRAVLAGGVAFDTPPELRDQPPAPESAVFPLYGSRDAADAATSPDRLEFLVYFDGSVRGLGAGSPVELRGVRIGSVTSVQLEYDAPSEAFRVPVRIAVEPALISFPAGRPRGEVRAQAERMVELGMRAQLRSGNLLTGQLAVALDAVPDAPPASVRVEGDELVLPSLGGGGGDVTAAVGAIAGALERFPLEEIGRNLNGALAAVNGLAGGPDLRDAVAALSARCRKARCRNSSARPTAGFRRCSGSCPPSPATWTARSAARTPP